MINASTVSRSNRLRRGSFAAFGYVLVFLLFWTAIPVILRQEPPGDNLEQLNWALHPALGYAKHPPLPTWALWLFEQFAPAGLPLTYLLGALEVLLTMALARQLGTATMDARRGWLGALLITCISYHTLRMHFYNHNTALLCANAAAMLCAWKAAQGRKNAQWTVLGVCWAAGMLCKYQMAVPIFCNLTFLAVALRHEPRQLLRGAALSGVVCAVLLTPHIVWLVQNHFPTFDYAATSLDAVLPFAARWNGLLHFLASQALRLLPALLLICMLHIQSRRAPRVDDNVSTQHPHATLFWTIHALGPLVLMSLMGGIAGVDLQMHWGTAFLWALPMWYLSTRHGMRLMRLPRAQMLAMIITVQSVLMTGKIVFPDL